MAHYIQRKDIKKWIKCDDNELDDILSNVRTLSREDESVENHLYHSVDVHRLIMKQKVYQLGTTIELNQLLSWAKFRENIHQINDYERSENLSNLFDDMTHLVDMTYGGYHISIDYIQVLIKWYLESISRLVDDYDIKDDELKMTPDETICLPHSSVILNQTVSDNFIYALNKFDFYRALGVVKTYPLYHIYDIKYLSYKLAVDILYYLYTVFNECITIGKSKSPVPIMINITDIKEWSDEMIQILFNVKERVGEKT